MARLLIENGGDIELRDSFGATAYDYAALREHVLLCFLLSASNTKLGRVSATAVLEAVVETERATLFAQYGKGDFPQFTSLSGTPTTLDNSLPSSEWFWVSAWRVVCEPETSTDGWRVRICIFIFYCTYCIYVLLRCSVPYFIQYLLTSPVVFQGGRRTVAGHAAAAEPLCMDAQTPLGPLAKAARRQRSCRRLSARHGAGTDDGGYGPAGRAGAVPRGDRDVHVGHQKCATLPLRCLF